MQSLKEVVTHVTTPTKESSVSKLKMLESLLNEVKEHNGIKFFFNKKCTLVRLVIKLMFMSCCVAIVTNPMPTPFSIKFISQ